MTRRAYPLVRRCSAVLVASAALLLGPGVAVATAHPLGNFSVNRYSGIVVAADEIRIDHVQDLAEIPTAQLQRRLADLPALAGDICATAAEQMSVEAGGKPLTLSVQHASARVGEGQAALPILRVECTLTADLELSGATTIDFADAAAGDQLGWREVTAQGDGTTLVAADVPADSVSGRLSSYPSDLLASPLDVRDASLQVRPGGATLASAAAPAGDIPAGLPAGWDLGLTERVSGLVRDSGPLVGALALVAAFALGAAHALAPGHGKTVMAFYLAGQRTRSVRAALTVGATVTATHTASVLLLGVAVAAGAAFVPDRLYAWLTVGSGLLIAAVGAVLLHRLLSQGSGHGHSHGPGHGHSHGPGHAYGHAHAHGHGHGHAHGDGRGHPPDHDHSHDLDHHHPEPHPQSTSARPGGRGGLVAIGLAGGLVPSPSALLLLTAAVGVQEAWFGVLLVLAFGAGMAFTLSAVGLLASGLRHRFDLSASVHPRLRSISRLLPLGAAGGVCLVGVGIVARTLASAI